MKWFILLLLLILSLTFANTANAKSDYVLPYPSYMPGNILYKPRLIWEQILKYWYFGNFGQFKYNLKQSDKYLIESKTLFEYNQFLNASSSLKKSDAYFLKTLPYLLRAEKEKKDISQNRKILKEAAEKHIEILERLIPEVPNEFEWKPEKAEPLIIHIRKDINKSIEIRQKYL